MKKLASFLAVAAFAVAAFSALAETVYTPLTWMQSAASHPLALGVNGTSTLRTVLDFTSSGACFYDGYYTFGNSTYRFCDGTGYGYKGCWCGFGSTRGTYKIGSAEFMTTRTRYRLELNASGTWYSSSVFTNNVTVTSVSGNYAGTIADAPLQAFVQTMCIHDISFFDYVALGDAFRSLIGYYVPVMKEEEGSEPSYGFYDGVTKTFFAAANASDYTYGEARDDVRIAADGTLEVRIRVSVPQGAEYAFNGADFTGPNDHWVAINGTSSLTVEPLEGQLLVCMKNTTGTAVDGLSLDWTVNNPAEIVMTVPTYQIVEYLKSTSLCTIPIGLKGSANMRGIVDFTPHAKSYTASFGALSAPAGSTWYFMNRNDDGGGSGCIFKAGGTELKVNPPGKGYYYSIPNNTRVKIDLATDGSVFNNAIVYDGLTGGWLAGKQNVAMSGNVSPAPIELFCGNNMTLFSAKFYDKVNPGDADRTLLRDFIPVVATAGDLTRQGLFDIVGKALYFDIYEHPDFTCGPAIEDKRISSVDGNYEYRVLVTGSAGCTVTVNGTPVDASGAAWVAAGANATVTVTPASGAGVVWTETDGGTASGNQLTATLTRPISVAYVTTDDPAFEPTTTAWTGGAGDSDFTNPLNWSAGAPNVMTRAVITPLNDLALTIADGTQLFALEAGTNGVAVNITVNGAVRTVKDVLFASGTMTFNTAKPLTVGGDLVLTNGAKFVHTAMASGATNDQLYKINLNVSGDVKVASDAAIDASNAGYYTGYYMSGTAYGCHAAIMNGGRAYGSISAPTNCGSGGWRISAGGGVVRLVAGGRLVVDGAIRANAQATTENKSAAGGSVWITCAALEGEGEITANGAESNWYDPGSGGRIAFWFTDDAAETAWEGAVKAYGGASKNSASGPAGTVYYQYKDGDIRNSKLVIATQPTWEYCGSWGTEMREVGQTVLSAAVGASELGDVQLLERAYVTIPEGETVKVYGNWHCNPATHYNSKRKATYQDAELLATTDNTVEFCGPKDATITGYTTFSRFVCHVPGKHFLIDVSPSASPKEVMRVNRRFELVGAEKNWIYFYPREEIADSHAYFKLHGEASTKVYYVRVNNSHASLVTGPYSWLVTAYYSEDDSENSGWYFDPYPPAPAGSTLTWIGGVGTQFMNGNNWDRNRDPDPADLLVIPGETPEGEKMLTLPLFDNTVPDLTINGLRVTSNATIAVNGTAMSITNLVVDHAKLELKGTAAASAESARVRENGVLVVDGKTFTVTDTLTVENGGTLVVTNAGALVVGDLVLESGARAIFETGDVVVSGDLTAAAGAKIVIDTASLTLMGDATLGAADVLEAGYGSVTVSGADAHALDFADATFYALTVDPSCEEVSFTGGFTAKSIVSRLEAAQTLTFGSGKTYTFKSVVFTGIVGGAAALRLQASTEGQAWKLVATSATAILGVRVSDCDASEGSTIETAAPSEPVGENVENWSFSSTVAFWTGLASDGKFESAANWSDLQVPGVGTAAMILPESGNHAVAIPDGTHIRKLVASGAGGTVVLTQKGAVTVDTDVDLQPGATLTFSTGKALEVGGAFFVRSGAKVDHTLINTLANQYAYRVNVHADSIVIEEGGVVTGSELGFYRQIGPGYQANNGGGHAGAVGSCDSYGSLFAPTNSGSGGGRINSFAGGVVRLAADGAMLLNGRVSADATFNGSENNGASGGSVWITCATLEGFGLVSADGASLGGSEVYTPGGGGRVSICGTGTDPFANWAGDARASGGGFTVVADHAAGPAGTVYYQSGGDRRKSKVVIGTLPGLTTASTAHGKTQLSAATGCDILGAIEIRDLANVVCTAGDGTLNYRTADVTVYQRGKLTLTADLTVHDLVLLENPADPSKKIANIILNGHKLKIRSSKHRNGRGWYSGWENYVTPGAGGEIIWLDSDKTVLRVR